MDANEHQRAEIDRVRAFIREHAPDLTETVGDSRWTEGKLLFRYASDEPGMYAYMVGPLKNGKISWHLMPLYAVESIRESCEAALKPFVTGKSCIAFKSFDDLPVEALTIVVRDGTPLFKEAMDAHLASRKRRK